MSCTPGNALTVSQSPRDAQRTRPVHIHASSPLHLGDRDSMPERPPCHPGRLLGWRDSRLSAASWERQQQGCAEDHDHHRR